MMSRAAIYRGENNGAVCVGKIGIGFLAGNAVIVVFRGGEGIWGSGEDHGESGDDGGVDIARSLATSASDHTGVGTGAGIEILAVNHMQRCGGGCGRRLISYQTLCLFADGADP
ncbi:hypothetical protein Tco_0824743 [Tanacetum coccineum]|uniref:Uncharacterized protein n=1 Tax=Tanacetum coccineum TaxID=301880 RepID=A0ABQ5ANE9_9ASTR